MASKPPADALAAGGEMGELIRRHAWANTALGPIDQWPPALRTALSIALHHSLPMLVWRGADGLHLYNDAFMSVAPEKHPQALGAPGAEVWGDIWDFLGRQARRVLSGGETIVNDHLYLGLRHPDSGAARMFNVTYSPVPDEHGGVEAVLVTLRESAPLVKDAPDASRLGGAVEAELRESEERLRIAIEASNIFIWEVDVATNFVKYSPNVADVLGFPLEPLASVNRPLVHPDDRERVLDGYRSAMKGDSEYEVEYRFVEPVSNEVVWVRAEGVLLKDARGNPERLIGVTQNITERKRRELNANFLAEITGDLARASRAAEMMRLLDEKISRHFDGAHVVFIEMSQDNREARVLDDWREKDGRSDLGPFALSHFFDEELAAALRSGQVIAISDVQNDPRTSPAAQAFAPFQVRAILSAPYVSAGRWAFTLALARAAPHFWRADEIELIRDLSARLWLRIERARAVESRFDSEARFRLAAEAAQMYSWEIDLGTQTIRFSENAARLLGYPEMQDNWEFARETLHPEDREKVAAAFQRALEETGSLTVEFRHLTAAKEVLWFELRGIVIPATAHEPARFLGVGQNVTERKAAEQALRTMNETLEERVRKRTQQVQDLATALTLAEQEERQRVAQVLHDDLQQRLYSLLVRMQMLQKEWSAADEPPAQLAEVMGQLTDAVQMTRTVVTELNPPVLETEGLAAALQWLAEHVEQMYRLTVTLDLKEVVEPGSMPVRALLVQMCRELLFNVVKHAKTTQAWIVLERDGDHLQLHVEDRGIGFDAAFVDARPMARGGYGLRSIRERLRLVGGSVEIHAIPGTGSRVTLRVPARPTDVEYLAYATERR